MDMNLQKYMAFVKTVEYGSFYKGGGNIELLPVRDQPYDP